VYDGAPAAVDELVAEGASGADSPEDLVSTPVAPRAVWVMVRAAFGGDTVAEVARHLQADGTVIDGGNRYYRDDSAGGAELAERGIHYLDIGTSGGVFGLERGYCMMIGGDRVAVERLDPVLRTLAPGVAAAARTPGRDGPPTAAEHGYLHCGPAGAGHFVK